LLNLTGGSQPLFYGRIVEGGRRAQTVLVEQRRRGVSGHCGSGPGRKRAQAVATTYSMKVLNLAAAAVHARGEAGNPG
jgi:hypothetical protein